MNKATNSQTSLPTRDPMVGRHVRLDPLGECDVRELADLLLDPRLYELCPLWFRQPTSLDDAELVVRGSFLRTMAPSTGVGDGRYRFTVRSTADGRLLGTTSVSEVDLAAQKGHVGATLYDPDTWGTPVNPETKLLLLGRCFEDWGFGRIKIQTDAQNTRSRRAIEKLGAVAEGVLRRESLRGDGTFRDVAVYSILRDEWPVVRAGLERRLAAS